MPHRTGNRKEQLAEAAAELFGRRGYHAVSVHDIAGAAGVTGPAVYRHFGSKQDVLAHVLLTGLEVFGEVSASALAAAADPVESLRCLAGAVAALAVERREVTALWRWQGSHLGKAEQTTIRRASARVMERWTAALGAARPELAPAEVDLLCWATLSVFGSVSVHHVSLPRKRFEDLLAALALAVFAHRGLPLPAAPPTNGHALSWPTSRREELLTAATRLFRERGYHAVSMEEIGAAAGIAGPSIYRHFAGKADILVAAGYRMAERLRAGAERAFGEAADQDDAMTRLIRSYVDIVLRSDNLMSVFVTESVNMAERDAKELVRVQRAYVAEWVRLLTEIAPGLAEREARITVHAALTIVNDLTRTPRLAARPGIAAELAALAGTVLRAGVSWAG
ncbi:MAG TPA: TetR/AcrR family transcriptional regulator [Actinophytocola sp.]|uniref:TetR/AcrR family transcriptional regulator n=1 Tax=Actinophytocola sp. TaxID=1872138 RepID=UPI002DBE4FF1|nr:TetR/AcrR family transcriptional regulator [Actinophytocola sp.]HEU5475136.1 TetR/AcrR family transcriptional regulator [Actinophytocola sp.]